MCMSTIVPMKSVKVEYPRRISYPAVPVGLVDARSDDCTQIVIIQIIKVYSNKMSPELWYQLLGGSLRVNTIYVYGNIVFCSCLNI